MKHIKLYEDFINESIVSDIKDFALGIKSDDDRLIQTLINNVELLENLEIIRGEIEFQYGENRFKIFKATCSFIGPDTGGKRLEIDSKKTGKLYIKLKKITDDIEQREFAATLKLSAANKVVEFENVIKHAGGIEEISKTLIDKIQSQSGSFNRGDIRYNNNELTLLAGTDTSYEDVNLLIVNFKTGQLRLTISYAAYSNYVDVSGELDKKNLNYLKKYIQIAGELQNNKEADRASLIKKMLK
jgi:hypothetical protein